MKDKYRFIAPLGQKRYDNNKVIVLNSITLYRGNGSFRHNCATTFGNSKSIAALFLRRRTVNKGYVARNEPQLVKFKYLS